MGSRKTSLARREFAACQDHWVFAGGKSRPVDIQPERGSASDITAPNAPQYDMAMQIVRFMKLRHRFGLAPRHDAQAVHRGAQLHFAPGGLVLGIDDEDEALVLVGAQIGRAHV